MAKKLKSLIDLLKWAYYTSNSKNYIKYLKMGGAKIGDNCIVRYPRTARIDTTRPSLITIGDNVDMNKNFQILTHDWGSSVFRNCYHDLVNSSGKVCIGSNIYFGTDVIVLKGVSIGDNCIIGAGAVIAKDIPANSVAAGVPCKVVCSLDEYYQKRKQIALGEAVEYVRSIKERFGRRPLISEMREEFIYFVDKRNIGDYPEIPIKLQLGTGYEGWLEHHKALFESFEDFIDFALDEDKNNSLK